MTSPRYRRYVDGTRPGSEGERGGFGLERGKHGPG